MKTIKTITCHDVYNVGAGLQAYALVTYLSSQGYDAEILNYKPEYLSRHYRLNTVSNPKYDKPLIRQMYLLAKLPRRLRALRSRKKKEFDLFSRQYLPVTQKKFHSNEELCAASPFADAYIAGSDQIWNPLFKNGKDPAFYLDFVKRGKKIAYAASFAVEELPLEMEEEVFRSPTRLKVMRMAIFLMNSGAARRNRFFSALTLAAMRAFKSFSSTSEPMW